MDKLGKTRKINNRSFRFRLGVAAFVLGTGFGYVLTGNDLSAAQMVSLTQRVKTALFVNHQTAKKDG
jgi:hypothetical protein